MESNKNLENKILEYFDLCNKEDRPLTISGLCLALNLEKNKFLTYAKSENSPKIFKMAKEMIENWIEEKSLSGKLNTTMAIFVLRSVFGWNDKPVPEKIPEVTIISNLD
jgi:hypothetical protein